MTLRIVRVSLYGAILALFIVPTASYSQTAQEQAATQNQTVIQNQEQRERFESQQRVIKQEKKKLGTDLKYKKSEMLREGACVEVKNVNIEGVTLLSSNKLLEAL